MRQAKEIDTEPVANQREVDALTALALQARVPMIKAIRDLSHWNKITDAEALAAATDAAIIKAFDAYFDIRWCPGHEDPTHDRFIALLRRRPFGEYLFHRPKVDPHSQVFAYQQISYHGMFDLLDVEDDGDMSNAELTSSIVNILGAGFRTLFRPMWLYANADFLLHRITRPSDVADAIGGIMLAYPSTVYPKRLIEDIESKYGAGIVKLWQWSWTTPCPGIAGDTDESMWLGTQDEWDNLTVGWRPNDRFIRKLSEHRPL